MPKPPFLSDATTSSTGQGPGDLTKNVPQKNGSSNFNPDSVPAGGRVSLPGSGTERKPYKKLGDGSSGVDGDTGADLD